MLLSIRSRRLLWLAVPILLLLTVPPVFADGKVVCTLSASATGFTAQIEGNIISGAPPFMWTLLYGDGMETTGSAATFVQFHTYAAAGGYTVLLEVQDVTGAMTTCEADVSITATKTNINVQEQVGISDVVNVGLPLKLNETINVADQLGSASRLLFDETLNIADGLGFPGAFVNDSLSLVDRAANQGNVVNESAGLIDQVSVSMKSSANGLSASPVVAVLAVVGIGVLALAVVWKVVLPRRR